MRAKIRHTELFFDVDGAAIVPEGGCMRERPTAFLIHGGPGVDHTSLKARYGRLAEKMQLVYFDHRGHGRSARGDPEKYTLDENVEDMEALRKHLGLGPIVSLGTSYGGTVAMAHAARYPASVSHLILVATIAHGGYAERAAALVAERGTAEQAQHCDDLFSGDGEPLRARNRSRAFRGCTTARHFVTGRTEPGSRTSGLLAEFRFAAGAQEYCSPNIDCGRSTRLDLPARVFRGDS
jgi:proline iminopeptidase